MLWTVSHVMTVEDRLTKQVNNDYAVALENAWWDKIVIKKPGTGRTEFFDFLLTTAGIEDLPKGQMVYSDLLTQSYQITGKDRGQGLKISRNDFEDDRFGFAGDWAGQMGAAMALDPQYLAVDLLAVGETAKAYDGQAYFSTGHPVNPFDAARGTYDTLITDLSQVDSTLSGTPTLSVANFSAGVAYVQSLTMPNGRNRNLMPALLVTGPKNRKTAREITGAKFISATENVLTDYKVEPLVINEITDHSWYLVSTNAGSELLPIIYLERRPYEMTSYTGLTQAQLGKSNELEWQVRGRASAAYGHPYQMLKFKVT